MDVVGYQGKGASEDQEISARPRTDQEIASVNLGSVSPLSSSSLPIHHRGSSVKLCVCVRALCVSA